jgi:hypothetical protein
MSYVRRKIDLTFQLGTGAFGETGFNTVRVSGLRVQCGITKANGPAMGEAQIRIHGLGPSLMSQLSALNQGEMSIRANRVIVSAGDEVNGMATVFEGQMAVGQMNLGSMPDSNLLVIAQAGLLGAVQVVPPSSYPGTADAAVIMADIARLMGLKFENSGVSKILATPYYPGSPKQQAEACAEAGRFEWKIDDHTLAIWPRGGARGGAVPLVSAATGLIGYPSYTSGVVGVAVTTRFNPGLRIGGRVEIQS